MKAPYRLTADLSFSHRLLLRLRYWRRRHEAYPTYTFVMQANPAGNKQWRKYVLRALVVSRALKALTRFNRRYLIEVKDHPEHDTLMCVGIFPVPANGYVHAQPKGPGHEGSLGVYFDLYRHELKHVPFATARAALRQIVPHSAAPPRHFNLPYNDAAYYE